MQSTIFTYVNGSNTKKNVHAYKVHIWQSRQSSQIKTVQYSQKADNLIPLIFTNHNRVTMLKSFCFFTKIYAYLCA